MATSTTNMLELQKKEFVIKFQIHQFSTLASLMQANEKFTTGPYKTGEKNELLLEFDLYPNGFDGEEGFYFGVKAHQKQRKPEEMWLLVKYVNFKGVKGTDGWRPEVKVPRSGIAILSPILVPDFKIGRFNVIDISVIGELSVLGDNSYQQIQQPLDQVGCDSSSASKFRNFKSLFKSEKFSDVKIEVGDQTFHAHKNILWLNCPYFMDIFDTTKEEVETPAAEAQPQASAPAEQPAVTTITVEGIKPEIFEEALYFIYTMECPAVHEMSPELLAAADILKMDDLKSLCEDKISRNLDLDNVCGFLVSSNTYSSDKLHSDCISFINDHLEEVRLTEGWRSVRNNYPQFGLEILEAKVFGDQKSPSM